MRKIGFILAVVLMVAAPVWGEVLITCEHLQDTWTVLTGYENTEGQPVERFALDISVDSGTITDVNWVSGDYYLSYIYPASIEINIDGEVTRWALGDASGAAANSVTVELTSLYDPNDPDHNTPPPDEGELLEITVDVPECCVSIGPNEPLGGVVVEDGNAVEPNSPGICTKLKCMKTTHPDYDEWQIVGEPDCWCLRRQCRGDSLGDIQYSLYWVFTNDLDLFKLAYARVGGDVCSDCNHDLQYGMYRVFTNDLEECFARYFGKTSVPCCDQDEDCDLSDGDEWFNFWIE